MMQWWVMPRVFPEMAMWGCSAGNFQYVISKDGDAPFVASAKRSPNLGPRIDLGDKFETFNEAKDACYQHWKQAHS